MKIEHWSVERDGALSEAAMREKLERMSYSTRVYQYPPGTRFDEHSHSVDKIDGVLSGRFRIEMEGRAVVLRAGDLVWVPKGTPHSAEVVGAETVVSLDAARR